MRTSLSSSWVLTAIAGLLGACTALNPQLESDKSHAVTADNQSGIWAAGIALYEKGQFLAAADLFHMAYQLKSMHRIDQNIGMAYFKAAQQSEHPDVLRWVYTKRAIPYLKSYRTWLLADYGQTHDVAKSLAEANRHITEAESLEQKLKASVVPQR